MTANEVIKKITKLGWVEVRQTGSHRIFKHPDHALSIVVPDHGKKDLKPGLLRDILKKAGLRAPD
jgi:predicted RNA binding protein YcfA (HicA-like mRNA interferase family)